MKETSRKKCKAEDRTEPRKDAPLPPSSYINTFSIARKNISVPFIHLSDIRSLWRYLRQVCAAVLSNNIVSPASYYMWIWRKLYDDGMSAPPPFIHYNLSFDRPQKWIISRSEMFLVKKSVFIIRWIVANGLIWNGNSRARIILVRTWRQNLVLWIL